VIRSYSSLAVEPGELLSEHLLVVKANVAADPLNAALLGAPALMQPPDRVADLIEQPPFGVH
jgi:hypothetical protein